jgi:CBF1 interacting co-repressor CIR-like protein
MGGGDLNLKKSWHPLTKRNLEIVWQLEQERNKEKQKLEQLRKEKDLESQVSDVNGIMSHSNPRKGMVKRLEWMYNSANTLPQTHTKSVGAQQEAKRATSEDSTVDATDTNIARNMRDDPLFMMKRRNND